MDAERSAPNRHESAETNGPRTRSTRPRPVRSLRASSNSSVTAALPCSSGVAGSTSPLCLDHVASQLEQGPQELDADQQSLLVLPSQLFQPLTEGTKARVVQVSKETLDDPDLLRLLLRVRPSRARRPVRRRRAPASPDRRGPPQRERAGGFGNGRCPGSDGGDAPSARQLPGAHLATASASIEKPWRRRAPRSGADVLARADIQEQKTLRRLPPVAPRSPQNDRRAPTLSPSDSS